MSGNSFHEVRAPRRTLVPGKLNVVGETHDESDLRRDAEKQFCSAMTGSVNYWTEAQFPDLKKKVGNRRERGGQGQGDPTADLMEFRAAHGAAFLIARFEKLAIEARTVAETPPQSAKAAVVTFLDVNLREFIKIRDRLSNSWRPTTSDDVNTAARAVYTNVEKAYKAYFAALHDASIDQQLRATRMLADKRDVLRALVPALEKAVGASPSPDRNAAALAHNMRMRRSAFIGLAAVSSQQIGVWKIGDLHVIDLTDGTAKVDTSRMNLVTEEDFTHQFNVWQSK